MSENNKEAIWVSPETHEMFKDWCLYNLELLMKSYESELNPNLAKPEISSPEGA